MTDVDSEDAPGALKEFREGFDDGVYGRPKQKNRTARYRNAYDKGAKAKDELDYWRRKKEAT